MELLAGEMVFLGHMVFCSMSVADLELWLLALVANRAQPIY